jgi:hypothetical protein
MYTYSYDASYSPSLPVVEVEVKPLGQESAPIRLMAMVDSGSDGTMMPLPALRQINARRTGQVVMRGITGVRTVVDIYEVTMQLGPHRFAKVRVAADRHNDMIILGRDVLNQIIVTLNGLASTTEIHD